MTLEGFWPERIEVSEERPAWYRQEPDRRQRERVTAAVRGVAVAAVALAALTSHARPTGHAVPDASWSGALAGVIVLFSSRATRTSWLWMTAVLGVAAVGSWTLAPSAGALFVAAGSVFTHVRSRLIGAAVGFLSSIALLHLPDLGAHGAASVVAAVAVLPVVVTAYRHAPERVRRNCRRVLLGACGFVTISGLCLTIALIRSSDAVDDAIGHTRAGLAAVGDGDHRAATTRFDAANAEFEAADRQMNGLLTLPARALPILAQHVGAVAELTTVGADLSAAGAGAAALAPYQSLRPDSGTLDLALVQKMHRPVAELDRELTRVQTVLRRARSPWLIPLVRSGIDRFSGEVRDTGRQTRLASRALEVAPALFGGEGDRTYLLLFTSPAESRFSGGFTGSYGVLEAADGSVDLVESGSITDLARRTDPIERHLPELPGFAQRYGRYAPARYLQNLSVSPDMPTTAQLSASLFHQITGTAVDGVLMVDPFGLAALLELTGPVEVPGMDEELTSDNAAAYLLRDQYLRFDGSEKRERKDQLVEAGRATFEALTDRRLPSPRTLGRVLGPVVKEKRLLFHPFEGSEQSLMDMLGADGTFERAADTDLVSLRTANLKANKIDTFLHRSLRYEASVDTRTGVVVASATVTLRNDAPVSGMPDDIIGDANRSGPREPTGTTRQYISLYSPLDTTSAAMDGASVPFEAQREFDMNVSSVAVSVPSGETRTIVFRLRGTLAPGEYRLRALSQPTANPDRLQVEIKPLDAALPLLEAEGLRLDTEGARRDGAWSRDLSFRVAGE